MGIEGGETAKKEEHLKAGADPEMPLLNTRLPQSVSTYAGHARRPHGTEAYNPYRPSTSRMSGALLTFDNGNVSRVGDELHRLIWGDAFPLRGFHDYDEPDWYD